MKIYSAIIILLFLFAMIPLYAQEAWRLEDSMLLGDVCYPTISPDGKKVAFTARSIMVTGDESKVLAHIWVGNMDGSGSFQLTRGDQSCWSPQWSPDGEFIAFDASRNGTSNIWLIRPDGGEAQQLTNSADGIYIWKFSPDWTRVAFLKADPQDDAVKAALKDSGGAYEYEGSPQYQHLYVADVDLAKMTVSEPRRITEGDFNVGSFDWSPDGKLFVVERQNITGSEGYIHSDIYLVPSTGGELKPLVVREGKDLMPLFSPDGTQIAFLSECGHHVRAHQAYLCLVSLADSSITRLADSPDSFIEWYYWLPSGKGLVYPEVWHTNLFIYMAPVDGSEHKLLFSKPGWYGGFREMLNNSDVSDDESTIVFAYEDVHSPVELYASDLRSESPEFRRISSVNTTLPDREFSQAEAITWKADDSTEIEGMLYYPLNYSEGTAYPLIVQLHGGPAWMSGRSFTGFPVEKAVEIFCSRDIFVFQPNYRGSCGYGREFRFASIGDMGGVDYRDIMSGVDALIERGMVDKERMAVMGWSYGGYMTSWIITQTQRFKVAVEGAGFTNMTSFTNLTDIKSYLPGYLKSELFEDNSLYLERSPILAVGTVTTPLLILHGTADRRVPVSQAYELYWALKRCGAEVELALFPGQYHGIGEPRQLKYSIIKTLKWICDRLDNQE